MNRLIYITILILLICGIHSTYSSFVVDDSVIVGKPESLVAGRVGEFTVKLDSIPSGLAIGEKIGLRFPSYWNLPSNEPTCDVIFNSVAVGGTTEYSADKNELIWTLVSRDLPDIPTIVIIVCLNIGVPRMTVENPTFTISTYTNSGLVKDSQTLKISSISSANLGLFKRAIVPVDTRANSTTRVDIIIDSLSNVLQPLDYMLIDFPPEWTFNPTPDIVNTTCILSQSNNNHALDVSLNNTNLRLTFKSLISPVLGAVLISCEPVRNPPTPRALNETVRIATYTAMNELIDYTNTAVVSAITLPTDPNAQSYAQQSFLFEYNVQLTDLTLNLIEDVYCTLLSSCREAKALWQFIKSDKISLTIAVFPYSEDHIPIVIKSMTAIEQEFITRVRILLHTQNIHVGEPTTSFITGTCLNDMIDFDEVDANCGGPQCPQCEEYSSCRLHSDCRSGQCLDMKCSLALPSTASGISPTFFIVLIAFTASLFLL